ncbi:MAG: DUF4145 domain-containing protein [Promethearchaeota archaeon]
MSEIDFHKLKISAYCPYCNQHTLITIVDNNLELCGRGHTQCVHKIRGTNHLWWIGECHNCNRVVLVLNNGIEIYPRPKPEESDKRIPNNVKEDFDEAKMCFSVNCYRASSAMSRRALETCCIDKGADKSKNLQGMIEDLFTLGIITKDIKDWADTVRWIGNDAVHVSANKVESEDAEDILDLAKQIFHIVYIAPAIAKSRQAKRKQSKTGKTP